MKIYKYFILILFASSQSFAQSDTTIITARGENSILQAVANLESAPTLFKGQTYYLNVGVSGNLDIKIKAVNAKISLAERGDKSTGGMRYTLTPIDTGRCEVTIGLIKDPKTQWSLLNRFFKVIEYPMPVIFVNGFSSGSIISALNDSVEIICKYDPSSGVFEKYPVKSWKATIDNKTFEGKNSYLTQELLDKLKETKLDSFLQIEVELNENATGYTTSKGIYIVNLNNTN